MRGLTSCYNEHAIRVSDLYCSRPSNSTHSYLVPKLNNPSTQNSVTNTYKLNHHKQFLITLTWTKKLIGQGFIINITNNNTFSDSDSVSSSSSDSNNNPPLFLMKNRGTETFQFQNFEVKLFWDLSEAKYDGPEPVNRFYVMVLVDSELGLFLGDKEDESLKKNHGVKFSMVSRSERFYGTSVYATKAKFCESGNFHEILIKCGVEDEGSKSNVLCLFMDKKMVFKVKRLKWNFRGNQTIFVDGLVVDLMWDLHDWIFNLSDDNNNSDSAVFLFRTRSGLDSRLWLEEKNLQKQKEQDRIGFSLLICGCKKLD
ncbi:unnamed protein product [Trifolium pratense]|uniref:Uncharacterized protein n=1 Tax=Trifolium pratense TaxID=57577 RepID=A0ACB0IKX6_TRIPR|nr:unnamed protein product [Trifolium pratense]